MLDEPNLSLPERRQAICVLTGGWDYIVETNREADGVIRASLSLISPQGDQFWREEGLSSLREVKAMTEFLLREAIGEGLNASRVIDEATMTFSRVCMDVGFSKEPTPASLFE